MVPFACGMSAADSFSVRPAAAVAAPCMSFISPVLFSRPDLARERVPTTPAPSAGRCAPAPPGRHDPLNNRTSEPTAARHRLAAAEFSAFLLTSHVCGGAGSKSPE